MPTLPDFGFCGPTYNAESAVLDAQRCINLYPEPGYGTSKSKMALIGTPGLNTFMTLAQSPVRGLWAGNNRLFACAGTHVYEVSNAGAVITDYGAIPNSTGGSSPVTFQHDGTHLILMDPTCPGSGGGLTGNVFNINPVGPTITQVGNNGGGNVAGGAITFLDDFIVSLDVATNNRVNVSNLGDGTTWNALNFIVRSGSSDLATWLEQLNGQLWIFGQKNIEVWYNAGNPLFPFARVPGATLNLGLLSQYTVVRFQNTIMWLGTDDRGYAQVYMTQGTAPVRVSNWAIEQIIASRFRANGNNPGAFTAFGYEEAGHTFFCLNAASQALGLSMLVYDLTTGLWHERNTKVGGVQAAWLPNCFASAPYFSTSSSGPNFVGDFSSGKIYYMLLSATSDAGANIIRQRMSPHVANKNLWTKHVSLELDADVGTAQAQLLYSNDGGRTYPHSRAAVAASTDAGYGSVGGGFGRFKWWQLGRSRDRAYQIKIDDNANQIALINAYLNAEQGTER